MSETAEISECRYSWITTEVGGQAARITAEGHSWELGVSFLWTYRAASWSCELSHGVTEKRVLPSVTDESNQNGSKALVLKEKINRKKTKKLGAVPEKTLPDLNPRMEKFLGIFWAQCREDIISHNLPP